MPMHGIFENKRICQVKRGHFVHGKMKKMHICHAGDRDWKSETQEIEG